MQSYAAGLRKNYKVGITNAQNKGSSDGNYNKLKETCLHLFNHHFLTHKVNSL